MISIRKIVLLIIASLIVSQFNFATVKHALSQRKTPHSFGWKDDHFILDGKPFQIISGEMHYPRIPRQYWRDRMRKARAMGLNTICTYIFWNLHEPKPGQFDFSGNLDIAAFVRTAQEEGLWVIIRPGPYICTEWDFGGLPSWLLATPELKVRSADPRFLAAADSYIKRVGKELTPLQITKGGPIIMTQVENEYGSFGKDHEYMNAVREMIRNAGFDVTLYTSDGSGANNLAGGTLPDVLSVINFGAGNPASEFASFAKFRQNVPLMCGEYWIGWFDHWGENHHTVTAQRAAEGLEWMLSRGISVNLYMFHGGTSFGFMNGANYQRSYEPDISGYDYDSPLDEAGRTTPKFFALREVIKKYLPKDVSLPAIPESLPMIEIPRIQFKESASLFDLPDKPLRSDNPRTMESLGQDYGFILYRKKLDQAVTGKLEINEARDYALVYQGKKRLGVLDRRLRQNSLDVDLSSDQPLEILVENMGRVNFGPHLVDDTKGIAGKVVLASKELKGWDIFTLPLDDLSKLRFSATAKSEPAFYRANFNITVSGDTFLDMRGWGHGFVWVNGHNLGRYWQIGPQQSLFVPSVWLKKGKNQIIVLDLEQGGDRRVAGMKDPVYETRK